MRVVTRAGQLSENRNELSVLVIPDNANTSVSNEMFRAFAGPGLTFRPSLDGCMLTWESDAYIGSYLDTVWVADGKVVCKQWDGEKESK